MGGDDWSLQFGAIDDARRIARFAPRVLASSSQIRKVVGSIASLVESLRSSLAKNALRCMGELFAALGKRMDQYLDAFLPVVLKRGADTNVFISDEAEATLREVCQHASETKALAPALAAPQTASQRYVFKRCRVWPCWHNGCVGRVPQHAIRCKPLLRPLVRPSSTPTGTCGSWHAWSLPCCPRRSYFRNFL